MAWTLAPDYVLIEPKALPAQADFNGWQFGTVRQKGANVPAGIAIGEDVIFTPTSTVSTVELPSGGGTRVLIHYSTIGASRS